MTHAHKILRVLAALVCLVPQSRHARANLVRKTGEDDSFCGTRWMFNGNPPERVAIAASICHYTRSSEVAPG